MIWNKYALNYANGSIIYDPEVLLERIQGQLIYTQEEALAAPKEVQHRLCTTAHSCGCYVKTLEELNT